MLGRYLCRARGAAHEVLSSLRWHLRLVSLVRGTTLCEAEEPLRRVYFVEDGATAEMATAGRSETIGLPFGTENCAAARDFLI